MEDLLSLIGIIWAVMVGLISLVVSIGAKRAKLAQQTREQYNARKRAKEEQAKQVKKTPASMMSTRQNATHTPIKSTIDVSTNRIKSTFDSEVYGHSHGAEGDEVELVPDITGSLGGVSTEGCEGLKNVRFLTKTVQETEDESAQFDGEQIAYAMILGSMFSQPKFKE
ncbi:MAG: hypothetical protein PHW00_02295 [Clostridia bacterium]|nr:hypothetical protein [Clostridia bacterium]